MHVKKKLTEVALKLIETGNSRPAYITKKKLAVYNYTNKNEETALMHAYNNNMTDVVLKLIQTGKLRRKRINKKDTALIYTYNNIIDVSLKLIETRKIKT